MGKVRKTAYLKALARSWGSWSMTVPDDKLRAEHPHLRNCTSIWANNRFECQAFPCNSSIGGVWQINILRHGDLEAIEWGELQRIVHELYGPEIVAVEVYPSIDSEWKGQTKHLRVLWILPSTWPLPFGLHLPTAFGKPA
jgi:hypothetical protein